MVTGRIVFFLATRPFLMPQKLSNCTKFVLVYSFLQRTLWGNFPKLYTIIIAYGGTL